MRKLVIFDLDGTLYKTEITTVEAVLKAAKELGLKAPSADEIISLIGETMAVFCRKLFPGMKEADTTRLCERIGFHEKDLMPRTGRLYDGVNDVLKELAARDFTLAICTNAGRPYIERVFTSCNIEKVFKYIKSCEENKSKTELTANLITQVKPALAVVVGDRLHDFTAASENNIPSIGVTYGYGNDEIKQADFTAEKPSDIASLIYQCEIFNRIETDLSNIKENRPVIVGVNGIDTSGKTSFTVNLSKYLRSRGYKTQCVHLDDFHNSKATRYQLEDEIESYIKHAFNLELLEKELLVPASEGKEVNKKLDLLDLPSDKYTNRKEYGIDRDTVVIVEGVLLYRVPLDRYFDYRVFLDMSFEELMRRASERDVPHYGPEFLERYHCKYIPIQKRYLEIYRPAERCDLIVDNNDFTHPLIR